MFATSPIFVTDNDYEFSIDPELITLVESDPFHGYESETVVAHLTKLHDIATLFTSEEKICQYYILKLFPFSLKDDAKTWFTSLAPGCVVAPRIWSTTSLKNISLPIRSKLPCRKYTTLLKLKKRVSHKLGGGLSSY